MRGSEATRAETRNQRLFVGLNNTMKYTGPVTGWCLPAFEITESDAEDLWQGGGCKHWQPLPSRLIILKFNCRNFNPCELGLLLIKT